MKKLLALTMVGLLGILSIAGCAKKEAAVDSEKTKITISEMRGESWIPVYAAEMLGYFDEEGLDPEWVVFKDGPIAFQGMHAGDSDFCMLSTEPVLRAYDEGLESKIILSTVKNKQYILASKPEITSIDQLKGKAVFAGMPGSAPYSFVLSALESAGLGENDVEWVNMEYGAALAALGNGVLDAAFFDGIYINELNGLNANILINTSDEATHEALYGSKYYESQMVTVTKKFAEENPETVQKFVNAVKRAMQWQEQHTDEELAALVSPMFDGRDMVEIVSILRSTLSNDGYFSKEGYESIEKFCLDQGIISKPVGYENIIDMSYIENFDKK